MRKILATLLVSAIPACGADGTRLDPLYWRSIYRPPQPHTVRMLVGISDDKESLLDWIKQNHPNVGRRDLSGIFYEFAVPTEEFEEVVGYLTNALNILDDKTQDIQPGQVFGNLPGPEQRKAGVRLGDFDEIPIKINDLRRDLTHLNGDLKHSPTIAELAHAQFETLKWYEHLDHRWRETSTLRLVLLDHTNANPDDARHFDSAFGTPDEFTKRWEISGDSIKGRGAFKPCLLNEAIIARQFVPDAQDSALRIFDLFKKLDGKSEPACNVPDGSAFIGALIPIDRIDTMKEGIQAILGDVRWVTRTPGSAESALLERQVHLKNEYKETASALAHAPALRGLIRAELNRLAPLTERREKTKDLQSVEIVISMGTATPIEAPASTPPPP